MNPDLHRLHPYPFEKLRALKDGIVPPAHKSPIALSIGEPKHAAPDFVLAEMTAQLRGLENYPLTKGTLALRNRCPVAGTAFQYCHKPARSRAAHSARQWHS